jgi:hypothetical protein
MNILGTNFGPGAVTLQSIWTREATLLRRLARKVQYAVVMYDYTNAMSDQLPKKLEPGDQVNLLLPFDRKCLLSENFTHVGLRDSYGRFHWAARKEIKRASAEWRTVFHETTSAPSSTA